MLAPQCAWRDRAPAQLCRARNVVVAPALVPRPEVVMAANCLCFFVGALAPLSLVSWLIAFH